MSLAIQIQEHTSDSLQKLMAGVSAPAARREMHHSMGRSVQMVVRDWLVVLEANSGATRAALGGGTKTDFFSKAAEVVSGEDALESAENSAVISLNHPGMRRAFQDVDIAPQGGKKYLTIPAVAEAYGKRASEFQNLRLMFRRRGGQVRAVALEEAPATQFNFGRVKKSGRRTVSGQRQTIGTVYFWLVTAVHQAQDRSILPSDDALGDAAARGADDFLRQLQARLNM